MMAEITLTAMNEVMGFPSARAYRYSPHALAAILPLMARRVMARRAE
jgi:hypothetical protein